ncbi:MAG: autotransporter-associated beta strand repeat-containing protein [Verrucomicrobiota bacterium]
MKSSYPLLRRSLRTATLTLTAALTPAAFAAERYWDSNGAVPGSDVLDAAWDATTPNWSTDYSGSVATTPWVAGDRAIFTAREEIGDYTVTLTGTQTAEAIHVESGNNVTLTGGTLALTTSELTSTGGTPSSSLRIASKLTAPSGISVSGGGYVGLAATGNNVTGTTTLDGTYLAIADQTSLGATPATLVPDSLSLANDATFLGGAAGEASYSLASTRGISLPGGTGWFENDGGLAFTIGGPVTGSGNLARYRASGTFDGKVEIDGAISAYGDGEGAPSTTVFNGEVTIGGGISTGGAGSITFNKAVTLGAAINAAEAGAITFNGPSLTTPGALGVAASSVTLNSAAVSVNVLYAGEGAGNSGTITQTSGEVSVAHDVRIGHWSTETSTYHISGGKLNLTGAGDPASETSSIIFLGIDGTGMMEISGGEVNAPGLVLDNRGDTPDGTDTLTLTGGKLRLGAGGLRSGSANGNTSYQINLSGGTLAASDNWSSTRAMTLTTGATSDTTFDPEGKTITLTGNLSGEGGLKLGGAGTLVLGGANDYTGPTAVSAGTLLLTTPIPSSALTISGMGTVFAGSELSSPVTVSTGGLLRPGSPQAAAATAVNRLAYSGGQTTFRVGAVSDALTVGETGGLSTSGASSVINIEPGTGFSAPASFTLIDYAGAIGGAGYNFTLGSLPHITATLQNDTANTAVKLNVTGFDAVLWQGNVNGTWDLNSTSNWKLESSGAAAKYFQADLVKFTDAAAIKAVTLAGTITPGQVEFNNSTAYTLSGVGIGGSGGLTKTGAGDLTLLNANTYAGNTTVNGGRLIVGNGTIGSLSPAGAVVVGAGGTLSLQPAAAENVPNSVSIDAAGNAEITGSGDATLSGVFTNGGKLAIKRAGVVSMTNGNHMLSGITVESGSTLRAYGGNWTKTFFGNQTGRSLTVNSGGILETTTHSLTGYGIGARYLPVITLNAGAIWKLNNEQYLFGPSLVLNGGTVNIDPTLTGTDLRVDNGTITVKATGTGSFITGNAVTIFASGTFDVEDGTAGDDLLMDVASLRNGGTAAHTLTKSGAGKMTVTSTNESFSGPVNVTGGTLNITGSLILPDGTEGELWTVASGASLTGTGTIGAPVQADAGSTISTGSAIGTLSVSAVSGVTLGGTYACKISGSASDKLSVTGSISIQPGSVLSLSSLSGGVTGASYELARASDSLTGTFGSVTGLPAGFKISYTSQSVMMVPSGPLSGFDAWAAGFAGLTDTSANGDPDHDGIGNMLEYVLGGIPNVLNTAILPVLTPADNKWTFKRSDASEADVVLTVQWSTDLQTWTGIAVGAASSGSVVITENGASLDDVSVTLPATTGTRAYVRLKAVRN